MTVRKMVDEKPMQKRRVSYFGPSDNVIQSLVDPLLAPQASVSEPEVAPEMGPDARGEPETSGTTQKCQEKQKL